MRYSEIYKDRIAPDDIRSIGATEIFVFGSNEAGRHGRGAAKKALGLGAIWGQAEGPQGRTYGIPTKSKTLTTLPLNKIARYVDKFIAFARGNPTNTFLVTAIGCGLARYKPKDIAPLFRKAIDVKNIHLPKSFWDNLE